MGAITRTALGAYTKAARLPLDAGTRLLGGDADKGLRAAAGLALDQVEATVLGVAGRALRDQELQDEAVRRFQAADERRKALELRARAEDVRQDGEQYANRKEADAESRREERKRQAARAEQTRRRSNARATQARKEAVQEQANAERLEAVEEKAEALEAKQDALTARDEAKRLGRAAAGVKAERKRSAAGRR